MKQLILLIFFFFCGISRSQERTIDSLKTLVKNAKEDTNFVILLNKLCVEYRNISNFESAIFYGLKAAKLTEKLIPEYINGLMITNNNLGVTYYSKGEYSNALKHFNEALKYTRRTGDKKKIAGALGKIGNVYKAQANSVSAFEYYFDALKIAEEINDKTLMVKNLSNIASTYGDQNMQDKALEYDIKALKLSEEIKDEYSTAVLYTNMGIIYNSKKNIPKALQCYRSALVMADKLGNKNIRTGCYGNIGSLYADNKQHDSALFYFLASLEGALEIKDRNFTAIAYGNVASVFQIQKKYEMADRYYKRALNIDSAIGFVNHSLVMHQMLSELNIKKGDFKQALEQYRMYSAQKDSVFNAEKNSELTKYEMNYEFEKKEAQARSEQNKKDAVTIAERKKQRSILALVCCVLILVFIFGAFVFRALKITKKQKILIEIKNKETEGQKNIIAEKNKEVLDSIHYAKRIQSSLLPTEIYIDKNLKRLNAG